MSDDRKNLPALYRDVFGHPNAAAVLEDLFFDAGIFAENTYAAHIANLNPAAIGVFEGKRRLALRILGMTIGDTPSMCKALAAAVMAQRAAPPVKSGPREARTENSETVQ